MKIVLDSNVFLRGLGNKLAWSTLVELFEHCQGRAITILIPEVVLLEIENKRVEEVKTYNKLVKELIKYHEVFESRSNCLSILSIGIEDELLFIRDKLFNNQQNATVEIIFNEKEHVALAVQRSLALRKPASSADKGLRDTFIWLALLSEFGKSNEKIIFITSNSKDFADKDKEKLNSDLLSEIKPLQKSSEHQIKYYESIQAYLTSEESDLKVKLRLSEGERYTIFGQLSELSLRRFTIGKLYKYRLEESLHQGRTVDEARIENLDAEREMTMRQAEVDEQVSALIERRESLEKQIEALRSELKARDEGNSV